MAKQHTEGFEAYGSTIFCEDIRYERSGQVSLIGVFSTEILVERFPYVMPKLGISVTIVAPSFHNQDLNMRLDIYVPGDEGLPSLSVPNIIAADKIPQPRGSLEDDIPPHAKIAQHLVISPLEVRAAGFIKVRVSLNDLLIKSGVIRLNLKSDSETQAGAQLPRRTRIKS